MTPTQLATTYADSYAAAQAAHDAAKADAADARGWDAFDRAVAAPATSRGDLRAKLDLARAMLARECPEMAEAMLVSLAADLSDA